MNPKDRIFVKTHRRQLPYGVNVERESDRGIGIIVVLVVLVIVLAAAFVAFHHS
jgi:hypothetical protein